jgi:hypothetical protein
MASASEPKNFFGTTDARLGEFWHILDTIITSLVSHVSCNIQMAIFK